MKTLLEQWDKLNYSDRYVFQKNSEFLDGRNLQAGLTTGTKIGTASTQKLGFWGATPVIQASAINAPSAPSASYSQAEAASAVTAINNIRTALTNAGITA